MQHPELLVAPALMLWSARLAQHGYRDHFKSDSYELNPIWRGDVARQRLINPRHLALIALLTGLLWAAAETDLTPWFFSALFGMVLGALAPIVAAHAGNIYAFDFLRRHPEDVVGEVTMSMRYLIVGAIANGLVVLVVFAVVAALAPTPLTFGLLAGASVLTAARFSWLARAKRNVEGV